MTNPIHGRHHNQDTARARHTLQHDRHPACAVGDLMEASLATDEPSKAITDEFDANKQG